VLEFSRSVHEDLSNYDPEGEFSSLGCQGTLHSVTVWPLQMASLQLKKNCFVACAGAWPVLVDEFVDSMYRYTTALTSCIAWFYAVAFRALWSCLAACPTCAGKTPALVAVRIHTASAIVE
jgi:hypothetical protein